MATFRLKRKVYSIGDMAEKGLQKTGEIVQNTAGNAVGTAGKVLNNNAAGVMGGLAGGAALASGLAGGPLGLLGGAIGALGGYALGHTATKAVGAGLEDLGDSMKT